MIDRRHIGLELPPQTAEIEKGRLRFFAKATGQTDPVYTDEDAAIAAGYPSLPAPPASNPSPNTVITVPPVDGPSLGLLLATE